MEPIYSSEIPLTFLIENYQREVEECINKIQGAVIEFTVKEAAAKAFQSATSLGSLLDKQNVRLEPDEFMKVKKVIEEGNKRIEDAIKNIGLESFNKSEFLSQTKNSKLRELKRSNSLSELSENAENALSILDSEMLLVATDDSRSNMEKTYQVYKEEVRKLVNIQATFLFQQHLKEIQNSKNRTELNSAIKNATDGLRLIQDLLIDRWPDRPLEVYNQFQSQVLEAGAIKISILAQNSDNS